MINYNFQRIEAETKNSDHSKANWRQEFGIFSRGENDELGRVRLRVEFSNLGCVLPKVNLNETGLIRRYLSFGNTER